MADGNVHYPRHPMVHQLEGDHYKILMHASGEIDLESTADGLETLARYKADADLATYGKPKPPRIPEIGEIPPSHLMGAELDAWLLRQAQQKLLPGEEGE